MKDWLGRLASLVAILWHLRLRTLGATRACHRSACRYPELSYFDNTGRDDVLTGGVKMIPITTPKGTFNVWTKRVGNNPRIKVLLLHGGPGATHEYFEAFDSYFPGGGHRVLLLRPARLLLQRPARRAGASGICRASSTRSSRCARRWASTRTTSSCSASPGAASWPSSTRSSTSSTSRAVISNMMASIPAYNDYAGQRADAGDGPGGAGRDQGARGRRRTTTTRATWSC